MVSESFLADCISFAKQRFERCAISPTEFDSDPIDADESSISSGTPPYAVSAAEAMYYYSGISPSPPRLVFRTSKTPWIKPTGPEAYRDLKRLCPVYSHKLNNDWSIIGLQIVELLDKYQVRFTSIDVVRFRSVKETAIISPVVLWIGVLPDSLLGEDAFNTANSLLDLLKSHDIDDVDVEYRESVYRRSSGAELYAPVEKVDPTKEVIDPLTTSLGLPIANARTPHIQGTLGFYFAEGGESKDILAVTARHVLFPPPTEDNSNYEFNHRGMRVKNVLLMGTNAWEDYVVSVRCASARHGNDIELYNDRIQTLSRRAADPNTPADKASDIWADVEEYRHLIRKSERALNKLEELFQTTTRDWAKPSQRVIAYVVRSPPITVNTDPLGFTSDFAIIKIDKDRFKNNDGHMNVLDLGLTIDSTTFNRKMFPRIDAKPGFKYPSDGLLKLQGIIPEKLLRNPDVLNINGEPCLPVAKNGLTTGPTIGLANGIFSIVREYFSNGTQRTSMELTIMPYGDETGVFSKGGDSGSIIVDGRGRFGGLLTGGTGKTESSDVTYATPFFWLWKLIKEMYPDAHLDPKVL